MGGLSLFSIKISVQYLEVSLFFMLLINLYKHKDVQDIVNIYFVLLVLASLYYAVTLLYSGTYIGNKNFDGRFLLGLVAMFSFIRFLHSKGMRSKIINLITFFFLILLLILSLEKKAWVAFSVSSVVVYSFYLKNSLFYSFKYIVFRLIILILFFWMVLLFLINVDLFSLRIFNQFNALFEILDIATTTQVSTTSSNAIRTETLLFGIESFNRDPYIGIGAGNFLNSYIDIYNPTKGHSAHNEYLRVLVELGAVGLISFLSFIFYFLFMKKGFNAAIDEYLLSMWIYGVIILLFKAQDLSNLILIFFPTFLLFLQAKQRKSNAP
jgi:O-antigen ligase